MRARLLLFHRRCICRHALSIRLVQGRTGRYALTPAQGLERGRDGGEVKVMTVTRA